MDRKKLVALGTYYSKSIIYDKKTHILYMDSNSSIKRNKDYIVVSLILISLPIVRWLNETLYIENILFRIILLFVGVIITYFFTRQLVNEKFSQFNLEVVTLSDFEKNDFY